MRSLYHSSLEEVLLQDILNRFIEVKNEQTLKECVHCKFYNGLGWGPQVNKLEQV